MSRIAILGASGGLGTQLVTVGLEHDFEVSALVRDPEKITRANYNLTLIKGDAGSREDVQAAIEGCQFVLSALGARKPVMAACMRNVVSELQAVKFLKRFVFVSWLGAGNSATQAQGVSELRSVITRTMRKKMFEDISRAEDFVRESRLPYVILRPTRLTDGGPTHAAVAVDAKEAPPGPISRVDLARFVFQILEEPGWERREVTVGSR
jgi:putative NADH-flavin reductase